MAALVVGVAVGRFVTYEPAASAGTPSPMPARTLAEEVARLEADARSSPMDAGVRLSLSSAYVRRAAETGDPAFYSLAEGALEEAERLAPDRPDALVARGNLALARHQFDDALAFGEEAVSLLPTNAAALGVLVDAQVELGRYDDAATTLQRMLDRRPGLPALARVSYLRELHGDLAGAVAAMRSAETAGAGSSADVAAVAVLLGDLHFLRGETDEAAAAYDRALTAAPGLPAARIGQARLLAAAGQVGAAVEQVSGLVERTPAPPAVLLLAELQHLAGAPGAEQEATAELLRTLASLQRDEGQVVDLELARFEADAGGDPARAVDLARAAYEARPDNVHAADALAWALHRAGRTGEALPLVDQALRLGGADPLLRFHAAEVLAAAGELERAAGELRTALRTPWFSFRWYDEARALGERLGVASSTGATR